MFQHMPGSETSGPRPASPVPESDKGRGVREFLDYAATRDDYRRVALPLANGLMMMTRRTA